MLETLLGLTLEEGALKFKPCLPAEWKEYKIHYRYRETTYHIAVLQAVDGELQGEPGAGVSIDGVRQADPVITLVDDGVEHSVEVRLPAPKKGQVQAVIESPHSEVKE